MKLVSVPDSVFVPYEWHRGSRHKVKDLPRFPDSQQALEFIRLNSGRLRNRKLDWEESSEQADIIDYISGVGAKRI